MCDENKQSKQENPSRIFFYFLFIYVQNIVKEQSEVLASSGCPCDDGKLSGSLIVDSLGWLRLFQVSLQVTESAVATQNLYSLLFYSGGSDTKILETREPWVLQVCCMKLENKSTIDYLKKINK